MHWWCCSSSLFFTSSWSIPESHRSASVRAFPASVNILHNTLSDILSVSAIHLSPDHVDIWTYDNIHVYFMSSLGEPVAVGGLFRHCDRSSTMWSQRRRKGRNGMWVSLWQGPFRNHVFTQWQRVASEVFACHTLPLLTIGNQNFMIWLTVSLETIKICLALPVT